VNFQEVVHSAPAVNADVAKQAVIRQGGPNGHSQECASDAERSRGDVRSVVEGGLSHAVGARQFNTTPKTVAKWVKRFSTEGVDGLRDRSSRPHSLPGQTPAATCATVEALRRQRYTGKQIAAEVGISPATVSRVLQRLGLNKLSALEPAEPIRRYERSVPAN